MRPLLTRLLPLLFVAVSIPARLQAQTAIPDTPAGHTLAAWLDAFNSGDRAKIAAFTVPIIPIKPPMA